MEIEQIPTLQDERLESRRNAFKSAIRARTMLLCIPEAGSTEKRSFRVVLIPKPLMEFFYQSLQLDFGEIEMLVAELVRETLVTYPGVNPRVELNIDNQLLLIL